MASEFSWWQKSGTLTLMLLLVLVAEWFLMNQEHEKRGTQLVNPDAVNVALEDWRSARNEEEQTEIETGLFIQSLKFFNSAEVNLTGYIWQRYNREQHAAWFPLMEMPPVGSCDADPCSDATQQQNRESDRHPLIGFILPDQVDSGSDVEPRELYRDEDKNGNVTVGWYFEATLRQPFEYTKYPFDHKVVWVRMWPKEFSRNVVLTPSFDSYPGGTGKEDLFGIERNIVLGAWDWDNTFFNYRRTDYSTNFGIKNYVGLKSFPELHFNFVIKRKFGNAFIVHLLPLFLVAALLYAALLTITDKKDLRERHGFNTTGVIGTCSALFFVVLLSHIQLREQFAGARIVYMECFYFLMYAMLASASAYALLFAADPSRSLLRIFGLEDDHLALRRYYWPALLFAMVLISMAFIVAGWYGVEPSSPKV